MQASNGDAVLLARGPCDQAVGFQHTANRYLHREVIVQKLERFDA